MGKRRHKRHAELHIAEARADDLPARPRWRLRALAVPWLVVMAVLTDAALFGVPKSDTARNIEIAAVALALLGFMHVLVVRILPVSRFRIRRPLWGGVTAFGYGGYTRGFNQIVDLYGAEVEEGHKRKRKNRRWHWWWWGP